MVNKFGLVLSPSSVIVDAEAWFTSISEVRSSVSPLNLLLFNNTERNCRLAASSLPS